MVPTRGYTRKIGLLSRPDSKLMCAQCHVEYNCNPGTDPTTGQAITMADPRTNHFPMKAVDDIGQHYKDLKFGDEESYVLVGAGEEDFDAGRINVASPLAQGLLGKKVGEKVAIDVPAGTMKLEILEVRFD